MNIDLIISNTYKLLELTILLTLTFVCVKNLLNGSFGKIMKSFHIDHLGHFSWMRAASSFVVLSTIILAFYQFNTNGSIEESLIIGLIGLALGTKAAQKFAENKAPLISGDEASENMESKVQKALTKDHI